MRWVSAWPTRTAAGFAGEALRLPEREVACDVEAVDAAAANDAGCGDSAAAGAAELPALDASVVACGDVPLSELLDGVVRLVLSVWLMSISCSRLFTLTSWLMYSLGSVSAVGSWFCISVTSSVRKSLADMVAELSLESLELLVPLVPDVGLVAVGEAALPDSICPAVV